MKTILSFCACLLALVTLGRAETGIVKVDRLNIRGQAKGNAEAITQLNKGDRVTILEKKTVPGPKTMTWLKIALPDKATVWIKGDLVKDGVVNADKVNVRSGAGTNFSIVGQAHKGDKVQTVRTLAGWDEIHPLPNCYGWVSNEYVDIQPELQPTPPSQKIEPAPVTPKVSDKPGPTAETAGVTVKTPTDSGPTVAPETGATSSKPVTVTGILHSSSGMLIKRPGTHSLWVENVQNPYPIAYLNSPKINLDPYEGQKVQVIGTETTLPSWNQPVIEVQDVKASW